MCSSLKRKVCKSSLGSGFTLFELLVLITVIATLAFALVPRLTDQNSFNLSAAMKIVESDIRSTQRLAMSKGLRYSIIFTSGSGKYDYGPATGGSKRESRDLGDIDSSLTISESFTVVFNQLGEPVGPRADMRVTVTGGVTSGAVTITAYTGKVTTGGI